MCFSLVLNYSSLRYLGHDINTKHIPSGEKYKMIQKINSIFSIFHVIITYLMSSFTSTITITIIKLNTKKVLLTYHYNEANDLKKFFEQIKSHNTLIKLKESLKRASKTDKNTFKSDVSQIAAASDENSARKKTRQKQQKTLKNQQLQQLSQQQPQQLQQKSQQLQQQQPSQKTAYSLKTYPETHKTLRQEFSIKKPQNPKAIKAGFKTTFIIFLLFSIHPSSSSSCSRDHWKSQATRCSYVLNEMTENLKTTWKQDGQTGVHRKTHTQTNEETIKQLCREWQRTNFCLQHLLHVCYDDPKNIQAIQLHISRLNAYINLCNNPEKYKDSLLECFLPEINSSLSCREPVDRYLTRLVSKGEFRSACRMLMFSVKCLFNAAKQNNCHQENSLHYNPFNYYNNKKPTDQYHYNHQNSYHRIYLEPLITHTRSFVLAKCQLTSPFKQVYSRAPMAYSVKSSGSCPSLSVLLWLGVAVRFL